MPFPWAISINCYCDCVAFTFFSFNFFSCSLSLFFFEFPVRFDFRSICDGDWKLIFHGKHVIYYKLLFFWNLDDPYYCGLRARVPNFVKSSKNKGKDSVSPTKRISVSNLQHPAASLASLHQLHQMHPQHLYASHHPHPQYPHHMMLHTRSFESGIGEYHARLQTAIPTPKWLVFLVSNVFLFRWFN